MSCEVRRSPPWFYAATANRAGILGVCGYSIDRGDEKCPLTPALENSMIPAGRNACRYRKRIDLRPECLGRDATKNCSETEPTKMVKRAIASPFLLSGEAATMQYPAPGTAQRSRCTLQRPARSPPFAAQPRAWRQLSSPRVNLAQLPDESVAVAGRRSWPTRIQMTARSYAGTHQAGERCQKGSKQP